MKMYHRYLLKSWCYNFLLSFCVINSLLLIGNLVRYGSKIGVGSLIPLLPAFLPGMLIYCLPIATLTATVSTLMRSRRLLEPITLASSGISVFQMMPPVVLMGALMSILTWTCFEWIQPWSENYKNTFLSELRVDIVESQLKKNQHSFTNGNASYKLFQSGGKKTALVRFKPKGTIEEELCLTECVVEIDRENKRLRIKAEEGKVLYSKSSRDPSTRIFGYTSQYMDIPPLFPPSSGFRQMKLSSMWERLKDDQLPEKDRCESYFYEKISMIFSPFLLIIAAFPLAFAGDSTNRVFGFMLALGLTFLVYFPLLTLGKKMVQSGSSPELFLLQMPNFALLAFIAFGLRRLNRQI